MSWVFQPLPLGGASSAGTSFSAAEVPSSQAVVPVRRRYAAAVYALALAFVPLVATATAANAAAAQGGATARRGAPRQYHALAGPVLVPSTAESLTLDKWKGTAPDRLQPRPHRPQPAGVAPIFVPDATTPAPALAWAGTFPAAVRPPARPLPLGGVVLATPPAPPTVDLSWLPQGTAPSRRLRSPVAAAVAPLVVPDVTQPAPALSWRPVAPDRVWGRVRVPAFPQPAAPLVVPDVTAPVVPLSWRPVTADRVWGRARVVVFPQAVAPVVVPDVTTPAPPLSWAARLPAAVARVRLAPISEIAAPVVTPAPAVLSLDWWQPPTLLRRTQGGRNAPGSVGPVAPVVTTPPPVLPALSLRPSARVGVRPPSGGVAPLYVPDVTAPAPLLSWQPQGLALVRRAPARPAPVLSAPLQVAPVALTEWRPSFPDRLPAPLRRLPMGVGVVEPPAAATAAALPAVQGGEVPWRCLDGQYQVVAAPVLVPAVVDVPWIATSGPAPVRLLPRVLGTTNVLAPLTTAPATAVAPAAQGGVVPWANADRQYHASVEPFVPALTPVPLGWYPTVPATALRRASRPLGLLVLPLASVQAPVSLSWLPTAPARLARPVRRAGGGVTQVLVVGAEPPGVFWPCEMWQYLPGTEEYTFDPDAVLQWVQPETATVYTFDAETQTWVMLPGTETWEW